MDAVHRLTDAREELRYGSRIASGITASADQLTPCGNMRFAGAAGLYHRDTPAIRISERPMPKIAAQSARSITLSLPASSAGQRP